MRKLLLLIVVLALGYTTVQAQEIRFGAKAGVNLASIGGEDVEDLDGRTSFHVGGLVEIPISEKFAIQPELLYSAQGAKREDFFMGTTYKDKLKLDYINIPIMAKYYVVDGLSIEAGPQFGILISAKGETEMSEGGDSESHSEDLKDSFKTLDIGLGLGAAYRLNNGIFFSARYIFGVSDITEDEEYDLGFGMVVVDRSKSHNNVFQISAGYSF